MGRSEKGLSPSSSSKRRRRNNDCATTRRKHLYLVLDDWKDGYSIHKLDPDDMDLSGHLSEPVALRLVAPVLGRMAFTALGTNIFVDTNRRRRGNHASPTLVYNTESAALTLGPRVPDDVYDLGAAMAVNEKLLPTPSPLSGTEVITYALHPDGHTIFMSTVDETHSFDTIHGVWRKLGNWVLPFLGEAYFDAELDAWVGFHHKEDGYICCCSVASRSATTTPRLELTMLKEKLFRSKEEVKLDHWHLKPTLTYMGDSRFCLVENILCGEDFDAGSVIHITLFGLKYDHKGELQTKVRRTTRSYSVSKNSLLFSHAVFWM
ncbi:unnamed protein product [Urochloa decumbens]|uniref:Uncharacterized protein n=1 Tax=Urochloa decumbens TaxID=240449 RepID=A0ABC9FC07_9POAL